MRTLWTALVASVILAATAYDQLAAQGKHRHREIVSQVHVSGNRRVPESEIVSRITTRAGDKYDVDQIDRDVRALYAMGHFQDVRAFSEDGYLESEGKVITFEVFEWPLISDIRYGTIDPDIVASVPAEWAKRGIGMANGSEYNPAKLSERQK